MTTGLIIIATGEKYHPYIQPLLASARTYFVPHTPIVFSDADDIGCGQLPFMKIPHESWPGPTLHRYRTMMNAYNFLKAFDNLFYIDVDMLFVAPVGYEIYADGVTATLHPGYVGQCGTPERRQNSTAYIPKEVKSRYFAGGFNGGTQDAFLTMASQLRRCIAEDEKNGIMAVWHDESHLNRYLWNNPPAKILSPSYCYPDVKTNYYRDLWKTQGCSDIPPKILALEKKK